MNGQGSKVVTTLVDNLPYPGNQLYQSQPQIYPFYYIEFHLSTDHYSKAKLRCTQKNVSVKNQKSEDTSPTNHGL